MDPNSPWRWSNTLRQWYYPRAENGRAVFVLETGSKIPAPGSGPPQESYDPPEASSTPRNPQLPEDRTILQQRSQPPRTGGNNPAYTYRSAGPQSPDQGPSQLTEQLRRLDVADRPDSGRNTDQSSGLPNVQTNERNGVVSRSTRDSDGEVLLGTPGDRETLDPSFQKRSEPRKFFRVGKVFFTLWTEPTTATGSNAAFTVVRFGEKAHSQIRRFVVVEERSNYCIAAQITTYGGQGVAKIGVVKGEHAIIYTGTSAPPMLPGERPNRRGEASMLETSIQVDPIQIHPSQPPERLDPKSRVNLGKAATVEHNLKVKPCGMVRNIEALKEAYNKVRSTGFSRNVTIPNPGRPSRQPSSGGRSSTYSPSSPAGPSGISVSSSAMRIGSTGSGSTAGSLPRGSGMIGPGSPPQVGSMQSRASQLAAMRRSTATGNRQQGQEEEEEQEDEEESSGEEDDSEEEDGSEDERPSQQPPRPPQGRGGGSAGGSQQRQRPPQRGGTQPQYYRRS